MELAFLMERLVMFILFCIWETVELDLFVLFFMFSNGMYFGLWQSKINQKETEKGKGDNGNISKESRENKANNLADSGVLTFLFWMERVAMFLMLCIWRSGTTDGLSSPVFFLMFSTVIYFALAIGEPDSENKQKQTEKDDNGNISKELQEDTASTDIKLKKEKVISCQDNQKKGGGNCSHQEEEKKGKDERKDELERNCSTIASDNGEDFNTTKEEDNSDKKETRKLKARLEEQWNILKMICDEAGKKIELEASRNEYEEDYRKKMKEKKEKWGKKLKQATEKYEEDCGKWEEERCGIAAKLDDATESTRVYRSLLQDSEENGRKLEEEKNNLTSQLCASIALSELYRAYLHDRCYQ